jgi:hypothetical protein
VGRPAKILIWALVFAACAGVGAYVAAHTDPFPPGVADPGARPFSSPSSTTSPSPKPAPRRWQLGGDAKTLHWHNVGGFCYSAWDVQASMDEGDVPGLVVGDGLATLAKDARCQFPTAVVQTETLRFRVRGTVSPSGSLFLRFRFIGSPDPRGSSDLGGFVELWPAIHVEGHAKGRLPTISNMHPDGNLGAYRIFYHPVLRCVEGC